ncbi:MAG: DUF2312 domain-containing protein [Rickettsia conorii subsp. raoultii]|uniref:UPF0335 protein RF_1180 n=26 Tax=spotted fever group TaxID=114277 RepID=Y1180_RICFE|nr:MULTISPECIES: DUF2312 domain-containing protein [Rickettsia]A8F0L8.1 RecName: Full=UPF0335 protein RMA_0160 [Rickettsia massiliae MTU5]C3PME9.1 RecName: Full=UPF0335 protein RAF_ORF0142 [Rickettsia africae ESF-5]C4K1R7.1 RecName: Full=UPF0335 protein RPR_04100 [Rickettsia peacockii str. Rustic]Q4UKA4.1 RecName: Full=UPF0335 protein RF_1180 [Rickettsia felis URRWXCal2]Q92JB4.1 RecName: Full=UPF0335 protein RC0153 [Rickettsia conorii str. Malish 7]MCC8406336.1 DUF2312 domain-containing prote
MSEVVVKEQLEQYISKIERLEQEKADLSQEVKDIFQDASSHGFDVKAMKSILKLKKLDKDKLAEQDAMLELYRDTLGI